MKDQALTLRFEKARVEWLRTHAKSLRRSVTSIIEEALDEYRDAQVGAKPPPRPPRKAP